MKEPNTMRRVVVSAYGGPEELRVETGAKEPHPGPGELLVDVEAAGINYLDVYHRKGIYQLPLPFSPGLEGLAGGSIFSYVTESAELQWRAAAVIDAIRAGWLRMGRGTAYDLDHVADAHRAIEGRGTQGKLYLTPLREAT